MISEFEMIIRIILAAFLGSLVGFEREKQNQPAGLRTHIILVVGSTLAMVLSINIPIMYKNIAQNGDPTRLAAQVISGIGFLGAGAILRFGLNVRGLTTATSLWSMAIVGLAVGAGYYIPAITTTFLLLVILLLVHKIEERLIDSFAIFHLSIKADDSPGLFNRIKEITSSKGSKISAIKIKKNLEENKITIDLDIRISRASSLDDLMNNISLIEGIRNFEIN